MKKIRTAVNLSKRFFCDWKEFSLGVAIGRLVRDVPLLSWNRRRSYYERQVLRYLDRRYGHIIEKYDMALATPASPEAAEKRVWIMWWQGEESMPPIVRACFERLKRVAPCEIELITEETISDWINLPEYIVKKHKAGIISTTHLSDVVRVTLLKEYGGLWLDATIWAHHIPESIWQMELYTLHAPGMFPDLISRGVWSTFLLYSRKPDHKLFCALHDFFAAYWLEQSDSIDYLLFDFAIQMIVERCPQIKRTIDSMTINNAYYELNLTINEVYSSSRAEELLKRSPLQKLTYKKTFQTTDTYGRETNYAKLLKGEFAK